jgi:hypothetical protein
MTRYKGRTSPEAIERDFPHHVEMIVPLGGFGKKLDVMHEWHSARGIEAMHGRGRRDEKGRNYIRWRFAGPTTTNKAAILTLAFISLETCEGCMNKD